MHKLLKIASYPFKGLWFLIYLIYLIEKYSFVGLEYIIHLCLIGFLFLCILIMHIFKYAFYALKLPFIILNKNKKKSNSKKEEKNIIKENKNNDVKEIKLEDKKEEIKEIKIENNKKEDDKDSDFIRFIRDKHREREKNIEDKLKANEANLSLKEKEEKRRKLDSEAYINENLILEKVTIGDKIKKFFAGIGLFFASFGKKKSNSILRKNKKNKIDIKREALLIDFEGKDAEKSEKKVVYEYVARDKDGNVIKDYFDAYSKVEVHSYLLSEGYEVYSIKTSKWIQIMHANANTNKFRFKNKDLIFFLTQLSTYLKAGIPLVEALRIISRQFKKKSHIKIFRAVIYELTVGENLSTAMEKQGSAFPKLLINMVKTAEMTGSLPEVLDDMANYYTEADATRKQMITALTYPAIVLVFSIGVMIFVMVYVVPKFVEIYDTMDTDLPGITKAILALSNFITHDWYWLILGIFVVIFALIILYRKNKSFRTACQIVAMRMPVFKNVIIYNEVTMFTKTFSSLLAHNVPITDSMEILNKITNNEIYKMLILDTITNLAKGGKISDAFKDQWAFPLPAYEMIVTGEATGELAEMMGKVSTYYQELHKNAVTRIKAFVEPALTVFLTVGVGIILLSIIIPMFNMYSAVQDME